MLNLNYKKQIYSWVLDGGLTCVTCKPDVNGDYICEEGICAELNASIDKLLSTPIGTQPCPECKGKGGWLDSVTEANNDESGGCHQIEVFDKCNACSGTGSVPVTVGDAINYWIEHKEKK